MCTGAYVGLKAKYYMVFPGLGRPSFILFVHSVIPEFWVEVSSVVVWKRSEHVVSARNMSCLVSYVVRSNFLGPWC
jgi:hypothetical protein